MIKNKRNMQFFLLPFSLVYGGVIFLRNALYDMGFLPSRKTHIFSVVVGNLSVGGTGKTPHIEYLIDLLASKKIAVLSRGYKRKSKGFVLANENSSVSDLGDEPFQIFQKYNIPVAVHKNRFLGIQILLEKIPQIKCVLLDDGFQHRSLLPNLAMVLTSYDNLYIQDWLLPAGNLRDTRKQIRRAHIVIITKCPNDLSEVKKIEITKKLALKPYQKLFFSKIVYKNFVIDKNKNTLSLKKLAHYKVLLITGIAKSKPLQHFLKQQKINFSHIKYRDHHYFSDKDIKNIKKQYQKITNEKKIILTTEKDFVRLRERLPEIYYLQIKIAFFKNQKGPCFEEVFSEYLSL